LQLSEQPCWPRRRRHIVQHRQPGGGPPNNVTAISARIHTRSYPAGRRAKTNRMPKQQVQSPGTRAMAPGLRQAMAICGPPCFRFQMLAIEVEHVDVRGRARRNANQRSRILSPEFAQSVRVATRLFEAMRRSRTLIFQAREAEPPIRTQRQSGIERRISVGAPHEPAPVLTSVRGVRIFGVVPATAADAWTGSVTALVGTLGGLPHRRGGVSVAALSAGAIRGALARKARRCSSSTIVRRRIFQARKVPAAIWL